MIRSQVRDYWEAVRAHRDAATPADKHTARKQLMQLGLNPTGKAAALARLALAAEGILVIPSPPASSAAKGRG